MADFQGSHKWMMTFIAFLASASIVPVSGCRPDSRQLHICLNIYLERDFPLIETIVKGQQNQGRQGRRKVILEGPDLQSICKDIAELRDCFSPLERQCEYLWQLDRFSRMMVVLNATHDYLCHNGTDNVKDLLLNSGCLERVRAHNHSCPGFDWFISWREVLRLQVSPFDRCVALDIYRNCLQRRLTEYVCGLEASRAYLGLLDVWLKTWCAAGSSPAENYLYAVFQGT